MTAPMKTFLAGLIKNCKSDQEKLQKIHAFCAQEIRYVAVEYGQSGHEPHKAETVFMNRYGDCKDQAILLVALLKAAGLKAYPVLIATQGVYDVTEDFPSINFNHAIACAETEGKLIFMDPTASTSALSELPDGAVRLVETVADARAFEPKVADNINNFAYLIISCCSYRCLKQL